jgi:DedD protein
VAVAPPTRASAPAGRASAEPLPSAADGARAQALLDGSADPPAPAASAVARFVVQVGAFTDAAALKETRAKVEKLGMKTYTQVAETPAGPRTRVRVGPFATRDEADRAASRIKAAALRAIILAL